MKQLKRYAAVLALSSQYFISNVQRLKYNFFSVIFLFYLYMYTYTVPTYLHIEDIYGAHKSELSVSAYQANSASYPQWDGE